MQSGKIIYSEDLLKKVKQYGTDKNLEVKNDPSNVGHKTKYSIWQLLSSHLNAGRPISTFVPNSASDRALLEDKSLRPWHTSLGDLYWKALEEEEKNTFDDNLGDSLKNIGATLSKLVQNNGTVSIIPANKVQHKAANLAIPMMKLCFSSPAIRDKMRAELDKYDKKCVLENEGSAAGSKYGNPYKLLVNAVRFRRIYLNFIAPSAKKANESKFDHSNLGVSSSSASSGLNNADLDSAPPVPAAAYSASSGYSASSPQSQISNPPAVSLVPTYNSGSYTYAPAAVQNQPIPVVPTSVLVPSQSSPLSMAANTSATIPTPPPMPIITPARTLTAAPNNLQQTIPVNISSASAPISNNLGAGGSTSLDSKQDFNNNPAAVMPIKAKPKSKSASLPQYEQVALIQKHFKSIGIPGLAVTMPGGGKITLKFSGTKAPLVTALTLTGLDASGVVETSHWQKRDLLFGDDNDQVFVQYAEVSLDADDLLSAIEASPKATIAPPANLLQPVSRQARSTSTPVSTSSPDMKQNNQGPNNQDSTADDALHAGSFDGVHSGSYTGGSDQFGLAEDEPTMSATYGSNPDASDQSEATADNTEAKDSINYSQTVILAEYFKTQLNLGYMPTIQVFADCVRIYVKKMDTNVLKSKLTYTVTENQPPDKNDPTAIMTAGGHANSDRTTSAVLSVAEAYDLAGALETLKNHARSQQTYRHS